MSGARIIRAEHGDLEAVAGQAAGELAAGRLVVIPTDTVYGVAAQPGIESAVRAIYRAKGRPQEKPLPLLASSVAAVERAGAGLSAEERALVSRFWPGTLTLLIGLNGRTEGVRVPDCEVARAVIRAAGGMLRVTSANLSGCPDALTAEEAANALGADVALVVDGGPAPGGVPSTVARVSGGEIEVLRAGAIDIDELRGAVRRRG